jgi:hypothetical protein
LHRIRDSGVNEMIAAFVGAEFDSTRFADTYRIRLGQLSADESVVRKPNLAIPDQNRVRHKLLNLVRGYPATVLFTGFPRDVTWIVAEVSIDELGECRYANHETWLKLSKNTRLVKDGAANVDSVPVTEDIGGKKVSVNDRIKAIAQAIEGGLEPLPIISLSKKLEPPIVLLEGHSRATAHVLAAASTDRTTVQLQLGMSKRMAEWGLW